MERREAYPWAGLALATLSALVLLTVGVAPTYVLAVFLVWAGTLWLANARAPQARPTNKEKQFSRSRFAKLIENAATPILVIERNRVTSANRTARELLGNHLVGQDSRIAFRQPEAVALLGKGASGRASVHGLVRPKDEWLLSLQRIDNDMSVIELISQTAQADISRAHTDFVANASHELRTPIASIIGYAETLDEDDGALPQEKRKKFTGTILSEAKRLQSLVSDLMSLSHVEAEKHDLPQNPLPLAEIVSESSREAAGPDRTDRLKLAISTDSEIAGDRRQIEQLIRNLVDNALKYGNANSDVTVSLEDIDGDQILLRVSDKGDGIASEHLPHLTRRFYRTDPGRSRASGGTGLGLAIVKHIVERHRARLDISSQQGKGTTVSVRFPRLIHKQPLASLN